MGQIPKLEEQMSPIKIENHQLFSEEFLQKYLSDGMGVMSKREIDILVMNLLMKYGDLSTRSNYDLSILLRIPEATIKRLRYEARLRYPPDEEYIRREFLIVLTNAKLELDRNNEKSVENMKLVFIMEDNFLRYAIQGRLKERGMFADTSFNTEIVKISCSSLVAVLEELYDEKTALDFLERCKSLLKSDKKEENRKILLDFALDTAKSVLSAMAFGLLKSKLGIS